MIKPEIPSNEKARISALQRYDILDTMSESDFDDITLIASQICGVPMALISLVDSDRQWFKSALGIDLKETSRDISFCAHAINGDELFEIKDAISDIRFSNNPLVTGSTDVRFYAGMPLTTSDGYKVGTICLLDNKPRMLSDAQRGVLTSLSRHVMNLMELRLLTKQQAHNETLLKQNERKIKHTNHALKAFNEVTTHRPHQDIEDQFYEALGVSMRYLGLEYAAYSTLSASIYSTSLEVAPNKLTPNKLTFKVEDNSDHAILLSQETVAIPNIASSNYAKLDCLPLINQQAYIAQLIIINNEVTGVVSFSSPKPRKSQFDMAEIEFIQMLSRWMASSLERKALEKSLVDSNFRAELAISGANLGSWDWNLVNDKSFCNNRWFEMLGYAPNEILVSMVTFDAMLHVDDKPDFYAAIKRHLDGESPELSMEFRLRHKNGSWVWIEDRGKVMERDKDGKPIRMLGTHMDITARKLAEYQITQLAFYDELTKLPNRRMLQVTLAQAIVRCERHLQYGAVMFLDMDHFKWINDNLGHAAGDDLLQQVADRLNNCVRKSDTVARFGGDEFVIILEQLGEIQLATINATVIIQKILETLNLPYDLNGGLHISTPSIGVVLFNDSVDTPDHLIKKADAAMYVSKQAGRNCVRFYKNSMPSIRLAA
ncbi:MAG: diguanylate cyclase [Methylophilaceae bacterium]|nr:diguanylate cyclase [Methylophilaceae bacterium]